MKAPGKLIGLTVIFGIVFLLSGCCPGPWPWCPDEVVEEEISFTPAAITRLCPSHIGGDREFAGHGPDVEAKASLEIRNSNQEIWVVLYLHAKETRSDWTEAEGTWDRKLWTVDPGWTIVQIQTDTSSETSYRDTDHSLDRPAVRGGSLVSRFEIMGDTGGNDVGNCTADDVYMNVYFNKITVKKRKI